MSQEPPGTQGPSDEERLSGTFFGAAQKVGSAVGGLSTVFASAGLASLILGLILVIFVEDLRLYSYIIMGAGAVLLLLAIIVSFGTVSRAVMSRQGRYSTNTAIMVVAFVGILAVVNFLAFEYFGRVDVTATKRFSLAPRTKDVLKNLDERVEAKVFFSPPAVPREGAAQEEMKDLLEEFQARTGKFSYEVVDPDVDPGTAREYEVTQYGNIVFESMESKKRHQVQPTLALEQDFVTALLIITGLEQKRVYFIAGHGERDLAQREPDTEGFGIASRGIIDENYTSETITLFLDSGKEKLERDRREGKVNMLVVAGPDKDLLDGEAELLDAYLKDGGSMLFMVEPETPKTFRDFLARWGILVGDGRIVDRQRSAVGAEEITVIARDQYLTSIPEQEYRALVTQVHPVLQNLRVRRITGPLDATYYPGVTALDPAEEVAFFPPKLGQAEGEEEDREAPTIFGTALAMTSSDSWLIEDPGRSDPQLGDRQGPFFPAVAIKAIAPIGEKPPSNPADIKVASIVAFGDTDFATNRYFYTSGNSDLFLNSVNWLVGDTPLANIRPKPFGFRELVLTANEFDFMRYSSWFLLPALMALAGGFVWWRRR